MKDAIDTKEAPAPIGPYSQAVLAGGFLFVSGQVGLDPSNGKLVPGDVTAQTERVMKNLGAILAAAGCSFGDVVRTTIYLVDLTAFASVNAVYGRLIESPFPARATVQVSALPLGAQVEIDAIALVRPS
jgi:2-iminobutanoate/2-iminopropanoate deaminase